jgi:UrcA family protein
MKNHRNPGLRPYGRTLGCAACAILLAATAFGRDAIADTPNSVRVGVRDLDLGTDAGAQRLLARIKDAANRVCGQDAFELDLGRRSRFIHCRAEAIEQAVRAADAPTLTALAHRSAAPLTLGGR